MRHLPGADMIADLGTKPLGAVKFAELKEKLGMIHLEEVRGEESQGGRKKDDEEEEKMKMKSSEVVGQDSMHHKKKLAVMMALLVRARAQEDDPREQEEGERFFWMMTIVYTVVVVTVTILGQILWNDLRRRWDERRLKREESIEDGSEDEEENEPEEIGRRTRTPEEETFRRSEEATGSQDPRGSGSNDVTQEGRPNDDPIPGGRRVYVTTYGKKYHDTSTCSGLRNARTTRVATLCPTCVPTNGTDIVERIRGFNHGGVFHASLEHYRQQHGPAPPIEYTPCLVCVLGVGLD